MAAKAQLTSTTAPAVVVATANSNGGTPPLATGTAGSRVPSANLENAALKKEALEKIARGINAGTIAVRTPAHGGGRVKVHPSQVATVLGAALS
jgi:alkylation response protein AidB-like acyl-CoA dehydrogenase